MRFLKIKSVDLYSNLYMILVSNVLTAQVGCVNKASHSLAHLWYSCICAEKER